MISECYSIHLYCDYEECSYQEDFDDFDRVYTRRFARRAGWVIGRAGCKDLCPKHSGKPRSFPVVEGDSVHISEVRSSLPVEPADKSDDNTGIYFSEEYNDAV